MNIIVGAKPAHWRRLRDLFIYLCVGLLVSRGLLRKSLRPETGKKMRESLGMGSAVCVESISFPESTGSTVSGLVAG